MGDVGVRAVVVPCMAMAANPNMVPMKGLVFNISIEGYSTPIKICLLLQPIGIKVKKQRSIS